MRDNSCETLWSWCTQPWSSESTTPSSTCIEFENTDKQNGKKINPKCECKIPFYSIVGIFIQFALHITTSLLAKLIHSFWSKSHSKSIKQTKNVKLLPIYSIFSIFILDSLHIYSWLSQKQYWSFQYVHWLHNIVFFSVNYGSTNGIRNPYKISTIIGLPSLTTT